jgi:chitodextrinase
MDNQKKSKHPTTKPSNTETVSLTLPVTSSTLNSSQSNEKLALRWLDSDVHKTSANLMTQKKLTEAVNYIKTFDAVEKFEEWLNRPAAMSKDDKFVLIVSGRL